MATNGELLEAVKRLMTSPKISTPADVAARLQAAVAPQIDGLIAAVERGFEIPSPHADGSHWIFIGNTSAAAVIEVKNRYQSAGWTVRIERDQRDGDALVLTPPRMR